MGLVALEQTVQMVCRMGEVLSDTDKEYVVQFALRTRDGELTNKLIDELTQPGANRESVYQRFSAIVDFEPDWIKSIENLMVSLELYRVQEEKALKALAEILSAYGIELPEKKMGELTLEKLREYAGRTEVMQR